MFFFLVTIYVLGVIWFQLHTRLVATVKSDEYLTRLKFLQQETVGGGNQFPFKEATGIQLNFSAVEGYVLYVLNYLDIDDISGVFGGV